MLIDNDARLISKRLINDFMPNGSSVVGGGFVMCRTANDVAKIKIQDRIKVISIIKAHQIIITFTALIVHKIHLTIFYLG